MPLRPPNQIGRANGRCAFSFVPQRFYDILGFGQRLFPEAVARLWRQSLCPGTYECNTKVPPNAVKPCWKFLSPIKDSVAGSLQLGLRVSRSWTSSAAARRFEERSGARSKASVVANVVISNCTRPANDRAPALGQRGKYSRLERAFWTQRSSRPFRVCNLL